MTDVEAKTPTKRKNSINQEKKASAKKPKLDGAKTPKKQISPKQQNKKQNISPQKLNIKKGQQKNDSPKKLKAFAGTKTINEKTPKKNKEVEKKEGAESKRKRRSKAYSNLMNQIKVENKKEEALVTINQKLKEIQDRAEITKTAKKKMRLFLKLKAIAENKPLDELKQQTSQIKAKAGKADKKKQGADSNIQKKQPQQVAQQSNKAKLNGKAKNVKPQIQNVQQKKVAPKQEDSDDDDEEDESDEEVDDEEDEEGEESDDEMDDEVEGEIDDEEDEDESDEESEEEANIPPAKVSNKKQKKK